VKDSKELIKRECSKKSHITICICTFKRPHLLKNLISKIEDQITDGLTRFNVVIVDNDPEISAENIVKLIKKESKLSIQFYHEPERSISFARNKCINEADGKYIVFIDDDEFPNDIWLQQLVDTIDNYSADGVLGPVEPYYDGKIPKWLRKSDLLKRDRFHTGYIIRNSKYTRTGNVIFKKEIFNNMDAPFDPKYGKIGGGDVEFFERMIESDKKFVWCDEAIVYEHIEAKRRKRMYYIKRAFTRGLTNSMKYSFFSVGTFKSLAAIPIYIGIVPITVLFGQHITIKYSVKLCDHLGKILGYLGVKIVKERPY